MHSYSAQYRERLERNGVGCCSGGIRMVQLVGARRREKKQNKPDPREEKAD